MHVQITAVFDAPVAAAGGKHTPRIGFGYPKASGSTTRWPKTVRFNLRVAELMRFG